jgi:hypothetical protein
MAMASGRMPGASLRRWPAADSLRSASRAEQVDGVIHALLGGEASPDTRRILESGTNPMLRIAGADTLAAELDAPDDPMGAADAPRPRRRPVGTPAELQGLAQILGLALGSPEFQRR